MKIAKYIVNLLLLILPFTGHSGGLFLYEVSEANVRLASAGWAARADDSSTVFTNPAAMSLLECPNAQVAFIPSYNHLKFHPNSLSTVPGKAGNASAWMPSGSVFMTEPINSSWTAGFAALSYWGSEVNYGRDWVGRYYVTKGHLHGISFIPAVSYQWNECLSFGIGANLMYSFLLQKSAINNVLDAVGDGTVKISDTRFGGGAILGVLYQFDACTRVGIQYLSRVALRFKDRPEFKNLGPQLEATLGNTSVLNSSARIDVNVPNSVIGSLYHEVTPALATMCDIGWQQWSKFGETQLMLTDPLTNSLTVPAKYKDTWHVALGAEYFCPGNVKLSGGIAYDSSMVDTKSRTFLLPVGSQWRFGTCLLYGYDECIQFSLNYEMMWTGSLDVDQNQSPLVGHVTGKYSNTCSQFVSLSSTWSF